MTTDILPRCPYCMKLLALELTRPWKIRCRGCKMICEWPAGSAREKANPMKRDMALVRAILEHIEEHEEWGSKTTVDGYGPEEITAHVTLLQDAALITCNYPRAMLTWHGHDVISEMRGREHAEVVALAAEAAAAADPPKKPRRPRKPRA